MDFGSSMESFQEGLLICRPRDPFGFAIRYFKDEKLPNPEEAHAVHMLPFLVFNHSQLQSALCTIYCHHTMDGVAPKSWLDSAVVLDIYQRMCLDTFKLKVKSIDEVTQGRIVSLKRIDFNVFVSCMRFPLACYQLVIWLQDKLVLLIEEHNKSLNTTSLARSRQHSPMSTSTNEAAATESGDQGNISGFGCLQLQPLHTVELHRIKTFLQKEQQQAQGSNSSSTTRLPPAGGSSLATLSQLSKASNNSNTVGANSRADRWHRLRSTSYHMHDCCTSPSSSSPVSSGSGSGSDHAVTGTAVAGTGAGTGGMVYGCGLMFSEAESQSLNQLLVTTVDVLIDSGGPNTVEVSILVDAFMTRYLKKMDRSSNSRASSPLKK